MKVKRGAGFVLHVVSILLILPLRSMFFLIFSNLMKMQVIRD